MELTKQQQALRGKKVIDMTNAELVLWIDACDLMERTVKPNKARRSSRGCRQLRRSRTLRVTNNE